MEVPNTSREKDELSPRTLYERMEKERERNNCTGIRELYAPYYLAKLLRQHIPRQIPVLSTNVGNENNIPFDAKWFKLDPKFDVFNSPFEKSANSGNSSSSSNAFGRRDRLNTGRSVLSSVVDVEMLEDVILPVEVTVSVEDTFFMDKDVKGNVEKILRFGQVLHSTKILNLNKFCRHFCEEIKSPPLELIWLLDAKYDLLGTSAYLIMLMQKEYYLSSTFAYQFLSFCSSSILADPSTRQQSSEMLEHFLQALVIADECNSKKNEGLLSIKHYSQDILHQITVRLISESQDISDHSNVQERLINTIAALSLPASIKQRYYIRQLGHIVCIKSALMPEQAVQQQEKLSRDVDYSFKQSLINVFIGPPQVASKVVDLIFTKLRNSDLVNWENLLLCVTTWEKMHKTDTDAVKQFKDSIKKLMYEGLEGNKKDKVLAALIIARHCSLIAPVTFFRYEKWYNSVFGSEQYSSPLRDLPVFNFFTEFLSQLVPIEPVCFLQVQATYWPYIPPAAGCKTMWSDYISSAKARIQEYHEIEGAMEFELTSNTPLQRDVEMATKAFASANKIPPFILEMCMFRKKYYMEQFLPALLKKPSGAAHTDARLRLIELLNAESKLPSDMYNKYKKGGFNI